MYVPDASIWVARFWADDPRHNDALVWITNVILGEAQIFAPMILLAEVAGSVARRAGDDYEGQMAMKALEDLSDRGALCIRDVDWELGAASADIAARIRLRGMDAIYAATAVATNSTLVTLDNEQRERASQIIPAIALPRQA